MSLLRRVVLLLGGVAALVAPASALEIPVAEPDTREWTALVMETEALLALQVPEQVLHDMQYRIFRWQQEAAAIQQAATLQVEQLQSRLSLFDDSQATESIAGDEIESLRQRITGNLNDAMTSLLLAEDIAQHATTLLRAIEDDLASRRSDRLLSLAASPLYPPAWLAAIGFLGTFAEDVISEITEGVGAVDLRDWSLNRLPVVLTALLFGILLLTLARHWTLRSFDGIRVRLSMPDAGAISNLSRLIADVVLPVIGVSLLVQSVQATGFPGLYASMLIAAIPWMAGTLYGVRWLNSVLFATADERAFSLGTSQSDQQDRDDQNRIDHEEPVQGPDHQGVAPIVLPLGWIAALEQLVRPLTNHGASTPIVETVVYYPFIIIAAYLLLRLGRRLVHHTESADREGNQVGRRILHGLARASLIVAVLSMILATIGLIPATRLMVFATINTFAVVAVGLTAYITAMGFYDYVASLLGNSAMQYWRGITKIGIGLILTLAGCVVLFLVWGASRVDLLIFWDRLQTGVSYGPLTISLTSISIIVAVFVLGLFVTRLIQSVLAQTVLPGTHLAQGTQTAIVTGTGYTGVVVSGLLAVGLAGFNLTNIAIVAGALSVGIGFGLQAIVSNFVSGIILLLEQPVREGDWIQTGSVSGTVKKISFRSTHVLTFDRALIVVPNSDLISNQVTNWTLDNRIGRITIMVGVAYGSNVEEVLGILSAVVTENESVTDDPAPNVAFMNFGADALEFEIRAVLTDVSYMISARSEINTEIYRRLAAADISIPFPQRDLWIRNPEDLAMPSARPHTD